MSALDAKKVWEDAAQNDHENADEYRLAVTNLGKVCTV